MTLLLKNIKIDGFKSFGKPVEIDFDANVTAVVGPNGSGKSNIAEAMLFVLGEQSGKAMRVKDASELLFRGSNDLSPKNEASVTLVFTNKFSKNNIPDDLLPYADTDEIVFKRTLYRDNTSLYEINKLKVRLKDVNILLAYASLGGHAYTIISQGEADRMLLASKYERRIMLENSLALGVYDIRIKEARTKIKKSLQSINDLRLLEREIAPLVKSLEEKIKKIDQRNKNLEVFSKLSDSLFFKYDNNLLSLNRELETFRTETEIENKIAELSSLIEPPELLFTNADKVAQIKDKVRNLNSKLEQIVKQIGKEEWVKSHASTMSGKVFINYKDFYYKLKSYISNLSKNKNIDIDKIILDINSLIEDAKNGQSVVKAEEDTGLLSSLYLQKQNILNEIEKLILDEKSLVDEYEKENRLNEEKRSLFKRKSDEIKSLEREKNEILKHKEKIANLNEVINNLISHHKTHIGGNPKNIVHIENEVHLLEREWQRALIKLEESVFLDEEETVREYKEVSSRLENIRSEIATCNEVITKLDDLILSLEIEMKKAFDVGLSRVSSFFTHFFGQIVEGGKAEIVLTKDFKDDEEVFGIDIVVNMPGKKVTDLHLFSGGEKTLVAIALLFALSRVSPPPFMVLDETDAPLDERNARVYGKMLRDLSKESKLLVVTHNRETMEFCDTLFGITMGRLGYSQIIKVNLTEAKSI